MTVAGCLTSVPEVAAGLPLRGTVVDPAGSPVAKAVVTVAAGAWRVEAHTDGRGGFTVAVPPSQSVQLAVRAPGFSDFFLSIPADRVGEPVRLTLALQPFAEQVTVTADRQATAIEATSASVTVIAGDTLQFAPSLALDETLRQVPGFTLFRRTGSLTANPTSQGASLRGLGASGASRALVLDDGIPLNDPFGGWIYWDRVPSALLDRVEVVRGGTSDLYGSGALGGVVNLVRRGGARSFAKTEASWGGFATGSVSMAAAGTAGRWSGLAAAELLRTGGYVPVAPGERGAVDTAAWSRHASADVSISRALGASASAFARASAFGESRGNGTPLQANDTRNWQAAGGGQLTWLGGELALRAHALGQAYNQSFSAIAAGREREDLVRAQHVPAAAAGGSGQWAGTAGRHRVVVGMEGRRVRGFTEERLPLPNGEWRALPRAGGTQVTGAVFASDTIDVASRLSIAGSMRGDWWRNGSRSASAASPRLGVVLRAGGGLSLVASAYRSFRAPNLNELYRSFRLGNIVTAGNDRLAAERLFGIEAGARYAPSAALFISARVFRMALSDAIANVTVSTSPTLIERQRQNLGRLTSGGFEFDLQARPTRAVVLRAGYLFDSALVSRFPADSSLEGRRVPQQPRHVLTLGALIRSALLGTVSLDARAASDQYDDDQNRLLLGPCALAGATWSRGVGHGLEAILATENLLNARCEVGKTPVTLLGPPRALRVGARVTFGAR